MNIEKKMMIAAAMMLAMACPAADYYRPTAPIARTDDAPREVSASPLFRKTMVILGDSYVQNHHRPIEETWHYNLAKKYQMAYYNYGRNGNTLGAYAGSKGGEPMVSRYRKMHTPADYVLVIAGHNDASRIDGLDPEAEATFRASVEKLVRGLKAKYPDAKIVFVSPWGVQKPGFDVVLKAYREMLPALGVLFYDAAKLSGIDPNDEAQRRQLFQAPQDTAHLNAQGHKKMLEKMVGFFAARQNML